MNFRQTQKPKSTPNLHQLFMQVRAHNNKLYLNFILSSTGKKNEGVVERASEHETKIRHESLGNPYINSINRNMNTKEQA